MTVKSFVSYIDKDKTKFRLPRKFIVTFNVSGYFFGKVSMRKTEILKTSFRIIDGLFAVAQERNMHILWMG